MLLSNRCKGKTRRAIWLSVAVILAAHVAAGCLICKSAPRQSGLGRMLKRAKRTATGLLREWF